ncbi:AMP-binding protein, partial [Candidatus Pacearchaeota archaeon]|nr:AMP-binding protein [Candidatus Pacearchaeota archaeon]
MSKVGSHLFKVFAGISQTYPSKKAVIFSRNDTYEALTYAQIFEQSVRLGNIFKNNDFNDDQRITIILENQPEYIISFFAVMYAGATVVPIDIQFSSQLIKSLMLVIDSKILITTERIGSKLRSILPDVQILMVDSQEFQEQMKQSSDIEDIHEEQLKNELAVLFFTSGTTELPKSVMLTHFNLLSNVRSIQGLNIVDKEDRFISILPLHHAYSFTVTFLLPLLSGATIVYPPTLTSVGLLTCMKETKTTVFVAVPQIFSLIYRSIHEKMKMMPFLKRGLIQSLENTSFGIRQATNINIGKKVFQEIHKTFGENLRFMISGGARLDPDIALAFKKWGFTMLEGYGLTETSPV